MPKSIGEFFNELAVKAGVAKDDESLKTVLASPELINIKVPDELVTTMDAGLLNIEVAKNNHPILKKKYSADAYDGIDKFMKTLYENDESLTPADIAEIETEQLTTKKIELLTAKLKAAHKKADPKDKEAINKQIADLTEAVRKEKELQVALKSQYEGKIKDIHKRGALTALFNNYKTIYDDLPGSIKSSSLEAQVNQALQDNGWELKTDDNGALVLLTKEGYNAVGSDQRVMTPQSFLDKTFAPILKVSSPPNKLKGDFLQQPAVPASEGNASLDFIRSHNQKALAEMESSPVQIM